MKLLTIIVNKLIKYLDKQELKKIEHTIYEIKLGRRILSQEIINSIVTSYYDCEVGILINKSRKQRIVKVRQVAQYFGKKYHKETDCTLEEIGQTCNKDHATVLHSAKTIENLCETNKEIKKEIDEIDKIIKTFLKK